MEYYILACRDGDVWFFEFGDYEREPVDFERDVVRDNGYRKSDTKVIKLANDEQATIDAKIAALNATT